MYSPPARGLLIHCWCSTAEAGAGVECGWKPAGRPPVALALPGRHASRVPRTIEEAEMPKPAGWAGLGLPRFKTSKNQRFFKVSGVKRQKPQVFQGFWWKTTKKHWFFKVSGSKRQKNPGFSRFLAQNVNKPKVFPGFGVKTPKNLRFFKVSGVKRQKTAGFFQGFWCKTSKTSGF